MDNEFDIFGDDDLAIPTMRGSANLDPQDYARDLDGRGSSILDDDLQEDTPSTPGRNPGAASAPDIDGISDWTLEDADDGPGMVQTTYGAHPWGVSAGGGYRPFSQQRTDVNLGDTDDTRQPRAMERDPMHDEPEVLNMVDVVEVPEARWHGNRNQEPSNRAIPSNILYDRSSYEYSDSTQNVIGAGVFDMEEGVTWRPRDGVFAHQYALPAYIGDEDELGVEQSEMFDTVANEWRVVQPSAGGVTLKTKLPELRRAYSPFVEGGPGPAPDALVPRPQSQIEAFGRKAAQLLIQEVRAERTASQGSSQANAQGVFLANALNALGPNMAATAKKAADRLVQMGYSRERALEHVVTHCIMHAVVHDLRSGAHQGRLPKLDRLASQVRRSRPAMQQAAAQHLRPLLSSRSALSAEMAALQASDLGRLALPRMGVESETPSGASGGAEPGLLRPRNLLIAAALGAGGYFAWKNRKSIARNARKIARKVGF